MRTTVTSSAANVIAQGPGAFLIRNITATATVYLETEGTASETEGFAWLATDPPVEIDLGGRTLTAIVASGGGSQTLHILRGSEPAHD